MRSLRFVFAILLISIIACQTLVPTEPAEVPTRLSGANTPAPTSSPTPPPPTETVPPTPTFTPSFTLTLTPTPPAGFSVRFHPDGGLYVGDQVSIEVIAPAQADLHEDELSVSLPSSDSPLGTVPFAPHGIGGRMQATLTWIWDTSGLEAGEHSLEFSVEPEGVAWTQPVTLQPASALPPPQPGANWARSESECCLVYYVTGTAAERDLAEVLSQTDAQAESTISSFGVEFSKPITVTLLPRVLGHGGFASGNIAVSYLDRNYAGSDLDMVMHHEMVHIIDSRLGGELRPSMLVEGLAVYLTGGHFKPEPLLLRAAALLEREEDGLGLGWYLPLAPLMDDFYNSQHEIGYLQAGALVEFMVDTWGWEPFSDFYRNIQRDSNEKTSEAVNAALREHFGLSLDQLEQDFLDTLRELPVTQDLVADVRLTVEYYDAVRRYQRMLDPSAYFLTAWLPSAREMRERGIVADYLRHPSEFENLTLEALLISIDEGLRSARYSEAESALDAVEAVLDALDRGAIDPFGAHPMAENYASIVETLSARGYEPQRIDIQGETARAWVRAEGPEVVELAIVLEEEGWELLGD